MYEVEVVPRSTARFGRAVDPADGRRLDEALHRLRSLLDGRRLWHVNSTATGGGVAEMLSSLVPYAVGADVAVRWLVTTGDEPFFEVTKRLHNRLHDDPGDGGPLGDEERTTYERTLAGELDALVRVVRPGDVVVLHDPQTAGLAGPLKRHGAHVVWRCHVGTDTPGPLAREGQDFLRRHLLAADAYVFSRPQHAWDGLAPSRTFTLAPCIDVLSPKNHPLDEACRDAILHTSGIVPADGTASAPPAFVATDGTRRLVTRPASLIQQAPVPPGARLVVQISRWDRLKDPVGLLRAFAHDGPADDDVHLLLVGPAVDGVADDPEGADTYDEVRREWEGLHGAARRRAHLVCVPMDDPDENAATINAVQRRADLVVQKSLAEGFGLTVAEAMWKLRPVIASRVGGLQDQIVHGHSGILIDEPTDLSAVGRAIRDVLGDPRRAERIGRAARDRVCSCFLPAHHFTGEAALVEHALAA